MNRWFRIGIGACVAAGLMAGCQTLRVPESQMASQVLPGAGEYIKIETVLLVIDASGSMYGREKFPLAKELTRSFVSAMPEGAYITGLVAYGGETTGNWIKHSPEPFNRTAFQQTASSLAWLGASTPLALALERLKPGIDATPGNTALIVLSDGKTDTAAVLDVCTAAVAAHQGELCIHTVQFGCDSAGGALLENMATLSRCGTFRKSACLTTAEGMQQFVRDVFLAPCPPGGICDARPGQVLKTVYFDFDHADIRADQQLVVDEAAAAIQGDPGMKVSLEGHTDSAGAESYNLPLSVKRSESVRDALMGRGIDPARLQLKGYGEGVPAAPNNTKVNRQLNRRVEIKAIK